MNTLLESLEQALGALPFEWAHYPFMVRALIGVMLICPTFALFGCFLLSGRMVLFGEVLGHAGLAGVGLGLLIGALDPLLPMMTVAVAVALLLSILRRREDEVSDTSVGFLMSFVSALGVVLITRGGNPAQVARYLTGDLLTLNQDDLARLLSVASLSILVVAACSNGLVLTGVHRSLASSRSVRVFSLELLFTTTLALTVTVAMPLVGVLVLGSLLIVPAVTARIVAQTFPSFVWLSILLSLLGGISGLLLGFYFDSAIGASIALVLTALFGLILSLFRRPG